MAYLPLYLPFYRPLLITAPISIFLTSALLLVPITLLYNFSEIFVFRREFKKVFVDSVINSAKSTILAFSCLFIISRFS